MYLLPSSPPTSTMPIHVQMHATPPQILRSHTITNTSRFPMLDASGYTYSPSSLAVLYPLNRLSLSLDTFPSPLIGGKSCKRRTIHVVHWGSTSPFAYFLPNSIEHKVNPDQQKVPAMMMSMVQWSISWIHKYTQILVDHQTSTAVGVEMKTDLHSFLPLPTEHSKLGPASIKIHTSS